MKSSFKNKIICLVLLVLMLSLQLFPFASIADARYNGRTYDVMLSLRRIYDGDFTHRRSMKFYQDEGNINVLGYLDCAGFLKAIGGSIENFNPKPDSLGRQILEITGYAFDVDGAFYTYDLASIDLINPDYYMKNPLFVITKNTQSYTEPSIDVYVYLNYINRKKNGFSSIMSNGNVVILFLCVAVASVVVAIMVKKKANN